MPKKRIPTKLQTNQFPGMAQLFFALFSGVVCFSMTRIFPKITHPLKRWNVVTRESMGQQFFKVKLWIEATFKR